MADVLDVAAAAQDLGHIVSRRPRAVVRATSIEDVVAIVRRCAADGTTIAVRGSGHTTFGQALCDGIVLDLSGLTTIVWADDRATIPAGLRWSEVVPQAIARGRTFPVLPDYLGLSVGGTLSSGGVGEATFARGTQTDHVLALEVVTGTGEVVTCSPTHAPELFDACRAGFGQCAIIVRAVMALVAAPRRVTLHTLRFPGAGPLLNAQRRLADAGVEYLQGSVDMSVAGTHVFTLNAATSDLVYGPHLPSHEHLGTLPGPAPVVLEYDAFTRRLEHLDQAMAKLGVWDVPHPWAFLFVPAAHAEPFLRTVASAFRTQNDGRVLAYLARHATCHTPNVRVPEGDSFLFGLLQNATAANLEGTLTSNAALHRAVAAVGGSVYAVGAVALSPEDWRQQLGPRWAAFEAAKRRFDPHGILTPGVRMFP